MQSIQTTQYTRHLPPNNVTHSYLSHLSSCKCPRKFSLDSTKLSSRPYHAENTMLSHPVSAHHIHYPVIQSMLCFKLLDLSNNFIRSYCIMSFFFLIYLILKPCVLFVVLAFYSCLVVMGQAPHASASSLLMSLGVSPRHVGLNPALDLCHRKHLHHSHHFQFSIFETTR